MDDVLNIIDEALRRKGLSDAAASMQAVGNFSLLKNMRSPRSSEKRYNLQALEKLAEVLDLELYFGPRRDPSPPAPADETFVPVPLHDVDLAAGTGALNDTEAVIGALAFRRDWLRGLGIAPSVARLARAQGDSMAPTIRDRDMVLIDTGAVQLPDAPRAPTDTRPRPIYSLLDQGAARLKRIERLDSRHVVLLSDNPDFAPEVRPVSAIHPIGRVRWWGHTVRE